MPRTSNANRKIVLIAENIRSIHNVGSLFRTAEGLGIEALVLCGYTPYPKLLNDTRLSHITDKLTAQISKTALGAEKSLSWRHTEDIKVAIQAYKDDGYAIFGLEQTASSMPINEVLAPDKLVIILGNEVSGLEKSTIELCDKIVEIPMLGKKESFNVVQAAAMVLFYFRYDH